MLNREQFDDLFSPVLNNTAPIFDILNEREKVDIMQALIGLTIFSDGSFDNKLHTLYSAFDDDGNESINRKELS